MIYSGASAQFVEHRFPKSDNRAWRVGNFCVEFNTFKNDKIGLQILDEWVNNCLEECTQKTDGIHWGDQKYLDPIYDKYKNSINVLENLGGGVAPWNISQYKNISSFGDSIIFQERKTQKIFELIFYHFEHITYKNRNTATAPTFLDSRNNKAITGLYADYLIKLEHEKKMLQSIYGIDYIIKEHPVLKSFKGGLLYYLKKIKEYIFHPSKFYVRFMTGRCYIKF